MIYRENKSHLMIYYVYYTFKNDEADKAYIGMTSRPIYHQEKYIGSGIYLRKAFKKYGKNSFTRIDLGEFSSIEEAHYWEGFYIKHYKTEAKYGGYNLSPKGGHNVKDSISEETKKKISVRLKGRSHGPMPEEQKERIRKSAIGKNTGKTPWNKGKPTPEKTKQKMRHPHIMSLRAKKPS